MNELKHHYSFTLQPEDSGQRLDKWAAIAVTGYDALCSSEID
ncbi:MAG: hypothetical protein ACLTE2_05175 [Eubacteriales bacterium]